MKKKRNCEGNENNNKQSIDTNTTDINPKRTNHPKSDKSPPPNTEVAGVGRVV